MAPDPTPLAGMCRLSRCWPLHCFPSRPRFPPPPPRARQAFDTPDQPYLPDSVLYRQKEQFSDGVGYDWVDGLKAHAAKVVSDDMWDARGARFPVHTPRTREYYLLRSIFEAQFPHPQALATVPQGLSIACSTPEALAWDPEWAGLHEISGRAIKAVHEAGDGFDLAKQGAKQ